MAVSPRVEGRIQQSHLVTHCGQMCPAVLLAGLFGGPEANSYPLRGVGFTGRRFSLVSGQQVLCVYEDLAGVDEGLGGVAATDAHDEEALLPDPVANLV